MCSRLYCNEVVVQEPHSQIKSNKNPSLFSFFFFPRIGTFLFGAKHIIFSNLWKTVNCLREKGS
jgi:hypothetical protein